MATPFPTKCETCPNQVQVAGATGFGLNGAGFGFGACAPCDQVQVAGATGFGLNGAGFGFGACAPCAQPTGDLLAGSRPICPHRDTHPYYYGRCVEDYYWPRNPLGPPLPKVVFDD